mgnify:CR=1 FL=1
MARVDRHKLENAPFDPKRGREGQVQAKKNAKGEVELVAYFGGKWYYCPMAEFNKTLNLRHGVQVKGSDVMTASQVDSSGFNLLRLNAVSNEVSPKLNEAVIFIDEVPATAESSVEVRVAANSTLVDYRGNGDGNTTGLKVGLNVEILGLAFPKDCFITALTKSGGTAWVKGTDADGDLDTIHINAPATSAVTSDTAMTLGTINASYPNVFFNILYTDSAQTPHYYHKFQLNNNTIPGFGQTFSQNLAGGQQGGGGGTGGSSGGGTGSGGGGGPL